MNELKHAVIKDFSPCQLISPLQIKILRTPPVGPQTALKNL